MSEEGWISTQSAASYLGVHVQTIWRLIRAGRLTAFRDSTGFRGVGRTWVHADEVSLVAGDRVRLEKSKMILKNRIIGKIEFEDDDLLTTGEAGLLAGLDYDAMYYQIKTRKIPVSYTDRGHRRVRHADVRAFIESRRKK